MKQTKCAYCKKELSLEWRAEDVEEVNPIYCNLECQEKDIDNE